MIVRVAAMVLVLASLLAPAWPGAAQQGRGGQSGGRNAPAAKAPEEPPEPPPPPYERDLLRLSEIVGSLAFLRALCTASDASEWPKRMQALMEAEGTTPARRERLAGAYNRGYRGYALTYRVCTPSAAEATARYLREGEALSRSLAGRFGG